MTAWGRDSADKCFLVLFCKKGLLALPLLVERFLERGEGGFEAGDAGFFDDVVAADLVVGSEEGFGLLDAIGAEV